MLRWPIRLRRPTRVHRRVALHEWHIHTQQRMKGRLGLGHQQLLPRLPVSPQVPVGAPRRNICQVKFFCLTRLVFGDGARLQTVHVRLHGVGRRRATERRRWRLTRAVTLLDRLSKHILRGRLGIACLLCKAQRAQRLDPCTPHRCCTLHRGLRRRRRGRERPPPSLT